MVDFWRMKRKFSTERNGSGAPSLGVVEFRVESVNFAARPQSDVSDGGAVAFSTCFVRPD